MSTTAKASDHVKPCNIAQSERHNRRDPDYIKSLDPARLYVRLDLSKNNSSYVAPGMEGVTLKDHLESIRIMVKEKTGRAMQENDVKYTDKNGKEKAIQIHLHKDEGHYEDSDAKTIWKPNYHAHIIWDWMDHETGKSFKLNADDMSVMQDMVAEALDMERGRKKSETGLDHLERNDFIIQKQEKEKKRLEEEKRRLQSEKDMAENKANEAKEQARKANEEKVQAEKKAQEAKTTLTSAESKITEKQTEIDELEERITRKEAVLDRLITETRTLRFEKYSDKSAGSDGWKDSLLIGFSNQMIKADESIRYCIHAIQDYAYSGFMCRGGGKHDCIFWPEEAHAIKKVMASFAEAFKTTLHAIGDWLVWMASKLGNFSDRELYRADNEVKQIADGKNVEITAHWESGSGLREILFDS